MNQKLIELISLNKNIWDFIRTKRRIIDETSFNVEPTILKIRYQGSVATKTIINPIINKGQNDIDLDIVILIDGDNLTLKNIKDTISKIHSILKNKFRNEKISDEENSFKIIFNEKTIDLEDIKLSLDFVVLFQIKNEIFIWKHLSEELIISDPFSMIDKFNDESAKNEDLRNFAKLIKSLRDAYEVEGLKSILILNSILKIENWFSWKSVIDMLKNDIKKLNEDGYLISATNSKDKLIKPSDFDYKKSFEFLNNIEFFDESKFIDILNSKLKNKFIKLESSSSFKPATKLHWKINEN